MRHGGEGVTVWWRRSESMVEKEWEHGGDGVRAWWRRSESVVETECERGGDGVSIFKAECVMWRQSSRIVCTSSIVETKHYFLC